MKQDERIFQQFLRRDDSAVSEFYNQHKEVFVRTVAKKGWGSMEDAERIYPQCVTILYYNILERKITLPLSASLLTYLITVGRNVMNNERRKVHRRDTLYVDPSSLPNNTTESMSFDFMDYPEEAKLLRRAMNSLGESCSQLITWFYIEGLSTEVIAERLNIDKMGTIRKRKHDCLKKLKQLFADYRSEIERYI